MTRVFDKIMQQRRMKDSKLVTGYSAQRISVSRGIYLSILCKGAFVPAASRRSQIVPESEGKAKRIFRENAERNVETVALQGEAQNDKSIFFSLGRLERLHACKYSSIN